MPQSTLVQLINSLIYLLDVSAKLIFDTPTRFRQNSVQITQILAIPLNNYAVAPIKLSNPLNLDAIIPRCCASDLFGVLKKYLISSNT